ncbi:HIPA PROTEIN [Bathymodiolus thermophilus thioautotrophic gill symbiont]|uniref:type II toxin-antitoxin system HipA family toxin n=1 Tax=Bathymodiolus thermophilus thioautotrophic gill symbiont TaxID=2360 RepID=UPI0010B7D960|nr:type II toxin-antitoxin system HipA family toxin [Bathymodiolus thermophilus thioautotrophic gill symbiont]SGZ75933.1 HIPA PROTEIN [Bathymodiolus thermophilus thioautotrophic gill symbiont]
MSGSMVNVMLWGYQLGAIIENPSRPGFYLFEYADGVPAGISPSPIYMQVNRSVYDFNLNKETFQGLPGLIADSLPDKFGNALVDQYMASQGIAKAQVTTLDRLLYMGGRGMGALEFEPAQVQPEDNCYPLAMSDLVESARKAIQGQFSQINNELIRIGSSAGGARPKAVVGWNRQNNDMIAGQFDLPQNYEHWLLKFDGVGQDQELGGDEGYGRIEFVYYLMALEAGIEMSESRLLEESGRAHFMTKRFDRVNNQKIHMQSFCALAHQDFNQPYVTDYTLLLRTAQMLNLGKNEIAQIYIRMVFNVLANNCDDHTKNFAFLMNTDGIWSLAPAFDVTHAHNPLPDKWTHQHQMLINGKAAISEIKRADLLTVAQAFRINSPIKIIDKVKAALSNWDNLASKYGVSDKQRLAIGQELVQNEQK